MKKKKQQRGRSARIRAVDDEARRGGGPAHLHRGLRRYHGRLAYRLWRLEQRRRQQQRSGGGFGGDGGGPGGFGGDGGGPGGFERRRRRPRRTSAVTAAVPEETLVSAAPAALEADRDVAIPLALARSVALACRTERRDQHGAGRGAAAAGSGRSIDGPQPRAAPDATPFVSLYARGMLRGCFGSDEGRPHERVTRAFLRALDDVRYGGIRARPNASAPRRGGGALPRGTCAA